MAVHFSLSLRGGYSIIKTLDYITQVKDLKKKKELTSRPCVRLLLSYLETCE